MLFAIRTLMVPSQRLKILDINLSIKNIYILTWQIRSVRKDLRDHLVRVFFICNPWTPRQHCVRVYVCALVHVCVSVSCQCLRLSWAPRRARVSEGLGPAFMGSPTPEVETAFVPSPVAPHLKCDFLSSQLSEPQDLVSVCSKIVVKLQQQCFLIAKCHVNVWLWHWTVRNRSKGEQLSGQPRVPPGVPLPGHLCLLKSALCPQPGATIFPKMERPRTKEGKNSLWTNGVGTTYIHMQVMNSDL